MTRTRLQICLLATILGSAAARSSAQVPHFIGFEGRLDRASGTPLPDGSQQLTFRLYDSTADPSELVWQESKTVAVKGGFFATALGDTTAFPPSLDFGRPLLLGVQVGSDPEMTPRQPVRSVPALALPYADSAARDQPGSVFSVTNTSNGSALYGVAGAASGLNEAYAAVWGDSQDQAGLQGTSVFGHAVVGLSGGADGVLGVSTGGSGQAGVAGTCNGGTGVFGRGLYGVQGEGIVSAGVYGHGPYGVVGKTDNAGGFGILGQNSAHGGAVCGQSSPGLGVGVYAGNLNALGFAGFETNFSGATTHIWCGENGNRVFSVTAGGAVCGLSFNQCSDARLKHNIEPLSDPLSLVEGLRGVSFQWDPRNAPRSFPTGRQIGFIAQEVERVMPEVVSTDADGYKSVAYQNLVPVLVEALKAQQTEIDALRLEVREARAKDSGEDELEARLRRLEAAAPSRR